jgi:Sigma-70 region 2
MREWSQQNRSDPAPGGAEEPAGTSLRAPLTHAESEFARELFERHRLSLYRYLKGLLRSGEEASEILQETYLRLLRQPSFDRVRENARAYLFQTATNLARPVPAENVSRQPDAGAGALRGRLADAGLDGVGRTSRSKATRWPRRSSRPCRS